MVAQFSTGILAHFSISIYITVGHNIYTTSIEIRPPEQDVIRRRSNWHNGYAYYCNGVFWANMSRVKVELI